MTKTKPEQSQKTASQQEAKDNVKLIRPNTDTAQTNGYPCRWFL